MPNFGGGNGSAGGACCGPAAGGGGGGAGMGGAIFNEGGTVTLTNCTFSTNVGRGGNGGNGENINFPVGSAGAQGGSGYGGALFNYNGTVTMIHCTFNANSVVAGTGGSGLTTGSNGNADGSAIYNRQSGGVAIVNLSNNTIPSNQTIANTGGGLVTPNCNSPAITAQPSVLVVCAGASANFSVTASGTSLSYQWRKGGVNLTNGGNISGANTATLTITSVTAGDAASYDVVVNSACGSITSNAAALAVETAPPTIACPANITQNTDASACTAVVSYPLPAAMDSCGVASVVCAPPSGAVFNPGVTTVNCTATDTAGNSAACSFTVTVNDAQAPTLTNCPTAITQATDPGACNAVVNYTPPTVSDNCAGASVNCNPAAGTTFAKGLTTVLCRATDAAGNSATCSFTVTVSDQQAPTLSALPSNITQNTNTGACTAVVNYSAPTATDNCGSATVTCTPPSGTAFAPGVTTVNCQAVDEANNTASHSFTVTINDVQKPVLANCPTNLVQSTDAGACFAVVNYTSPTASDNCAGVSAVSCTPASGSAFTLGTTTVTCAVRDAANNTESCSFNVTVNDTQAPVLSGSPGNLTQNTDANACTAVVNYVAPTATDNCGTVPVNCSPPAGAVFAKGVTTVTCTATDAANNSASVSFNVTVNDAQQPSLANCPANQSVAATSAAGAVVNYAAPTATDNCGTVIVDCQPAFGSTFAVGATTVTCTATDGANNRSSCSFTIAVDCALPGVTTEPVAQTACAGGNVLFTATANGNPTVQWQVSADGGNSWNNVVGGSQTTLALNGVTTALNGNRYRAVFTNFCGTVTSNAAMLTVNASTALLTSPANQAVCLGATASFSVNAAGTGLSYQWRKDGMNIGGATASSYAITAVTAADAGSYAVVINGTCGNVTANAATLTVNPATTINTPPASLTRDVGQSATFTVTANGANLSYQWRKNGTAISGATAASFTIAAVTAADAGDYDVAVSGTCGNATSNVAVLTVSSGCSTPVVSITAPASGAIFPVGATVNLAGAFTDSGEQPHTANWNFTSNLVNVNQTGVVNEAAGTVSASASLTQAGVYQVKLTVTNNCGKTGSASTIGPDQLSALIVVYDPNAGHVTGGGWINSPPGAYVPNPALTGKANFGFVSKYKNGNSVPDGNTEFQFKAGNLNFKSTVYEWLVIAGARAQFKGSGTINNAGDYRFTLTAIDGQVNGGGGQDKFRIRIWNNAGGGLVYDNQLNDPDSSDPTTVLGGGSIVIHKNGGNAALLATRAVNDFDGDGKSDLVTWNSRSGGWLIARSSDGVLTSEFLGSSGDVPVAADYDGDGRYDAAVWRPAEGSWRIKFSGNGSLSEQRWGTRGDVPVPGDYDGDGRADLAVWRPSEGRWYVWRSTDGGYTVEAWGTHGDIVVPGDYDGDGKADLAVWRPSNGTWYVKRSPGGQQVTAWGAGYAPYFDVPVAADYDGDGKTDLAIWRGANSLWYIRRSSDGQPFTQMWGANYAPYHDVPVLGDYDGDGKADIAVWRPANATWYVLRSTNGTFLVQPHGQSGDTPVPVFGVR